MRYIIYSTHTIYTINICVGLQGRFVIIGIIHFILLPYMIIFMTISFFLQNAQSFHTNKSYLGPRQWSPLALWTFRVCIYSVYGVCVYSVYSVCMCSVCVYYTREY